jgi:hypothetical protein
MVVVLNFKWLLFFKAPVSMRARCAAPTSLKAEKLPFSQRFLCLSRAYLGKMMTFLHKMAPKKAFCAPETIASAFCRKRAPISSMPIVPALYAASVAAYTESGRLF